MDKATEAPKRGRPRTAAKPKRDPERTRSRILEAATDEFTKHGLGGARVDRIAKRAGTNERMLYYYFISKDQLFLTVLELVYIRLAEAEKALELDHLEPVVRPDHLTAVRVETVRYEGGGAVIDPSWGQVVSGRDRPSSRRRRLCAIGSGDPLSSPGEARDRPPESCPPTTRRALSLSPI